MDQPGQELLFTIGHSSHTGDAFLALLRRHGVRAVVDVRSSPYSRHCPQFNRETLDAMLRAAAVGYVFLGKELGARPADPACYEDGRISFARIAGSGAFLRGLDRLREIAAASRAAVMCSEKDPLDCHRAILLARRLHRLGVRVVHILGDGALEDHAAAERRLVRRLKVEPTLFDADDSGTSLIERAYRKQEHRIACRPEREAQLSPDP